MRTLPEAEARKLLTEAGIPLCPEAVADSEEELVKLAETIGFPCVLKGTGEGLEHKTELGVVFLNIRDASELVDAAKKIREKAPKAKFLIQKQIEGSREFICGLATDELFGPAVMFGLGGIFTEALKDVAFRLAPLSPDEAKLMLSEIKAARLLDEFRGERAADRDELARILVALGDLAVRHGEIVEIDLNPVIIDKDGKPTAVDYLVRVRDA